MLKKRKDLESKAWYRLLLVFRYLSIFLSSSLFLYAMGTLLFQDSWYFEDSVFYLAFWGPALILTLWSVFEFIVVFVIAGSNADSKESLLDDKILSGARWGIGIAVASALVALALHTSVPKESALKINFTNRKTGAIERVPLESAPIYKMDEDYRMLGNQTIYYNFNGRAEEVSLSGAPGLSPEELKEAKREYGIEPVPLATPTQVIAYLIRKEKKRALVHFLITFCVCSAIVVAEKKLAKEKRANKPLTT